jgi:PilZ domain-containing protein
VSEVGPRSVLKLASLSGVKPFLMSRLSFAKLCNIPTIAEDAEGRHVIGANLRFEGPQRQILAVDTLWDLRSDFLMTISTALFVSAEPGTIQQFGHALQEWCISPDVCRESGMAINLLNRKKFDAVIVDLQIGEESGLILDQVYVSRSNRTAVTFAIAGSEGESPVRFRGRTSFVFERPFSAQSIRNILKPAYGLILRERRRYFRCPASVPVTVLTTDRPEVCCTSLNISEGGMALSTFVPLNLAAEVQVQFTLPGHEVPISAKSRVCWLKSGLLGVQFSTLSQNHKSELQGWLAAKLEEILPESVAGKFRK